MKRISTAILVLGVFFGVQAQEESSTGYLNKHEFRIDALEILAIPNLELNYEYVISKYSGVGATMNISLDNEFNELQKFSFAPYFRQYFLNKKEYGARGLFVEGLLQFASGDGFINRDFDGTVFNSGDDWFDMGVGIAIGQKWVSENGFIFEISAGGGRYLLNTDDSPGGFFRGGILIGYRFF